METIVVLFYCQLTFGLLWLLAGYIFRKDHRFKYFCYGFGGTQIFGSIITAWARSQSG